MRAQQGRSSARSHTLASGSKEALRGQQRSPEQETQGEAWLGSGMAIRLGVAAAVCGPHSARAPPLSLAPEALGWPAGSHPLLGQNAQSGALACSRTLSEGRPGKHREKHRACPRLVQAGGPPRLTLPPGRIVFSPWNFNKKHRLHQP